MAAAETVASPAVVQQRPVEPYLVKFASMKTERLDFDRKNQLVSDYILPRRDFSVTLRPNQLRPHRVTSSVATAANARCAAFLLAYLIDPTRPNMLPNVKRGLAQAGRQSDMDDDGINYLGALSWSIFDHMMLPRAQLMMRLGAMLQEFCAFGNGVIWTGRRRGFGPYFNTRPFHACWWSENERGEIDTLYFRMLLPLYRIVERWPSAKAIEGWEDKAKKHDQQELSPVLLCVEPRPGGLYGAVARAKPFKYICIAEDKKFILEESGFNSFPYSVFRDNPMPGQAYAEGIGAKVLPDVMVLNHFQQAAENIAEQKGQPPLAWPARMFNGKPLDRRPGAPNSYNPAGLGLTRPEQAILKLDFTGELQDPMTMVKYLTDTIERGYFVDWMNLRETGDMTAEEVSERRDMRLRGAASIVANCELPMTHLGDRVMEILAEESLLPRPIPQSVAGADVDWEYAGPLAVAQLRGNVQSVLQLINARGLVLEQDPAAAEAVDLETCLRTIQAALATPTGTINSAAKVQAARVAMAQKAQQQHNAQQLATVAGAAKDGASAATAVQPPTGAPPAGGGAAFAPAAPLAQPVAA